MKFSNSVKYKNIVWATLVVALANPKTRFCQMYL
jgi:hypothetical protein